MTDAFTHALVLQTINNAMKHITKPEGQSLRILDIGCGHGYISFALALLMKLKGLKAEIMAIDSEHSFYRYKTDHQI
jgi:2-polyprenyl-3-methyl-5-hydroxy-6-metoxy-1,4-benzoquinol methylase